MEKINKFFMGWVFFVAMTIGVHGNSYAANIFDLINDTTKTKYKPLVEETFDSILYSYRQIIPTSASDPTEIDGRFVIPDSSLPLKVESPIKITTDGDLDITGSEMYVAGSFFAESTSDGGAGKVSLGRIAPRPPIPLPGKDLLSAITSMGAGWGEYFGAGIIAQNGITMQTLSLDFGSGFTPFDGARLVIAASELSEISLLGALSVQGIDPTLFRTTFKTISGPTGTIFNQLAYVELSTIPEPGTMILLGFGLLGLAGIGRRKSA